MKCALTGANGFLGSHLADRLLKDGHQVTALVRESSELRWIADKGIRLVTGALDDAAALAQAFEGAELIFHLAGAVVAGDPAAYYRVNQEAARAVAEAALGVEGLRRFVLVSTLAVHGVRKDEPGPVNEESGCEPVNHYGRSKLGGEEAARALCPGLPLTVVRPGGIYGPRDTASLALFQQGAKGIYLKMGFGRRLVNMCHVADIVDGILLAAARDEGLGETFLLGDAENYTLEQLGQTMVRAVRGGRGLPLWIPLTGAFALAAAGSALGRLRGKRPLLDIDQVRMYAVRNWAMDVGKARRLLGYRPRYTLLEGATETAAWYREQGWL